MSRIAHTVHEKSRTDDVIITENVDFNSLLLSKSVSQGLANAGFHKPSPIQLKAIPLGRCGLDLIVQAKSGTGKTCVFAVIALETIQIDSPSNQVLVLAPTREIAVQIWEVIGGIGSAMTGLKCHTFIGGLPLHEDRMKLKKSHIAVGTPGRVKQLIETGVLKTESIRLFVLDEADKLLEESFQEQINWIYSSLPDNKQMLALSATYPEYLADHLTAYMRNPTFLRLNISDPALLGIRQYYRTVPYHPMSHVVFEEKKKALTNILSSVSFQQCLIFSNLQTRAKNLADSLNQNGWPTACIAGCLDQKDRNHAMSKLKTYKCRILISTDLTARGIDADKVNVIINLDVPKDHETYLHRIGRAGRFGSFGIAVSLISDGQERMDLNLIEKRCNTHVNPLPDPIPEDLANACSPVHLDDVVSSEVIKTDKNSHRSNKLSMNKTHSNEREANQTDSTVSNDNDKQSPDRNLYSNDTQIRQNSNIGETSKEHEEDKDNSKYIHSQNSFCSPQFSQAPSIQEKSVESGAAFVNGHVNGNHKAVKYQDIVDEKTDGFKMTKLDVTCESTNDSPGWQERKMDRTESDLKLKFDEDLEIIKAENAVINGSFDESVKFADTADFTLLSEDPGQSALTENPKGVITEGAESGIVNCAAVEQHKPDNVHSKENVLMDSRNKQENNLVVVNNPESHLVCTGKQEETIATALKNSNHNVSSCSKEVDHYLKKFASDSDIMQQLRVKDLKDKHKARLLEFKPPVTDLISVFKQTVGHKSVKNPHTYESAVKEINALDEVEDFDSSLGKETETVSLKSKDSKSHEALLSSVNELLVMFDKAAAIENWSVLKENIVCGSGDSIDPQNYDTKLSNNARHIEGEDISKADCMNGNVPFVEEKQSKMLGNVPFVEEKQSKMLGNVPFVEEKQSKMLCFSSTKGTSADTHTDMTEEHQDDNLKTESMSEKPKASKQRNRRGYTGKFAIAHMLHQNEPSCGEDEGESKIGLGFDVSKNALVLRTNESVAKSDMKLYEGVNSLEEETTQEELTSANMNYNADSSISVLESVPGNEQINSKIRARNKENTERKVSFSSDELVTEDSDSDDSSTESEDSDIEVPGDYAATRQKSETRTSQPVKPVPSSRTHFNRGGVRNQRNSGNIQASSSLTTEALLLNNKASAVDELEVCNGGLEEVSYPNFYPHQYHSLKTSGPNANYHSSYPGWSENPFYHQSNAWQQYYPPNFMSQMHHPYQSYPQQYPWIPYHMQPPYMPYSVHPPYSGGQVDPFPGVYKTDFNSEEKVAQSMKHAFQLQNDYIRKMCAKTQRNSRKKKKC